MNHMLYDTSGNLSYAPDYHEDGTEDDDFFEPDPDRELADD